MNKNENFYDVEVKDMNKLFIINGKTIRSPFKTTIPAKDLEQFLCMIRAHSVNNYSYTIQESKDIISIFKNKTEEATQELNGKILTDIIENEQKNTRYDLRSKFTLTDTVDVIIVEVEPFTNEDIINLQKLRLSIPYYEPGEYHIGNMLIEIKKGLN